MEQKPKYNVGDMLWFGGDNGKERCEKVVSVDNFFGTGLLYHFNAVDYNGQFYYLREDEVSPISLRERVERLERILGQLREEQ